MKDPVFTLKGMAWERDRDYWVREDAGPVNLSELLRGYQGHAVVVTAFHTPNRSRPYAPGMGSCFAGKHCRAGHPMNPFMLWDFHGNGVLSQDDPDTWRVGGMTLDLRKLDGHECSVSGVLVSSPAEDGKYNSTKEEASQLSEILRALQEAIKRGL